MYIQDVIRIFVTLFKQIGNVVACQYECVKRAVCPHGAMLKLEFDQIYLVVIR